MNPTVTSNHTEEVPSSEAGDTVDRNTSDNNADELTTDETSSNVAITVGNGTADETDGGFFWVAGADRSREGRRLRFGNFRKRHGQWSCFLCCHVRTGTIVIGFWHLVSRLNKIILIKIVFRKI